MRRSRDPQGLLAEPDAVKPVIAPVFVSAIFMLACCATSSGVQATAALTEPAPQASGGPERLTIPFDGGWCEVTVTAGGEGCHAEGDEFDQSASDEVGPDGGRRRKTTISMLDIHWLCGGDTVICSRPISCRCLNQ